MWRGGSHFVYCFVNSKFEMAVLTHRNPSTTDGKFPSEQYYSLLYFTRECMRNIGHGEKALFKTHT